MTDTKTTNPTIVEALRAFSAAAGAFGGYAPAALAERMSRFGASQISLHPESIQALVRAAHGDALAKSKAEEGPLSPEQIVLRVDDLPQREGDLVLHYGGGRSYAELRVRWADDRVVGCWLTAAADVEGGSARDLRSAARSVDERVAAAVDVVGEGVMSYLLVGGFPTED